MADKLSSTRFSWQSYSLFVGLSILGYLFAGFLHMPGDGPPGVYSLRDLDMTAGLVGFAFGAVTGLVVAGLQWIALRSWVPKARSWILLNALGFGLVHAAGDAGVFTPYSISVNLLFGGLVIGLAQAIALRRSISRVYLWPPVAAIAWTLGFQIAFALEKVFAQNPLPALLGYGAAGLVVGAITGLAIYFLLPDGTSPDADQMNLSQGSL